MVREESLAGVMAEVYGRLTRRPGVLIGQGPWVLGNGMIGTIEAYLSSSPMLLLTDFSDATGFQSARALSAGDRRLWQLGRAARLRRRHQAGDAGDTIPAAAVQATQLAIKHALAGQPGPVAVLFAQDSLAGTIGAGRSVRRCIRRATTCRRCPPPADAVPRRRCRRRRPARGAQSQ